MPENDRVKDGARLKKIIIIICSVLVLVFIAVISYGSCQLLKINADYAKEAEIYRIVLKYKPEDTHEQVSSHTEIVENQSVIDLKVQYPDAVGWLTIPNAGVDHPFVQYSDNDYYLYRDINGTYASAGTIFVDYRCKKDFSSRNTIIYGHHMKNGSMFGNLSAFSNPNFFNDNKSGTIYLPNDTLMLEFFAYMVIHPGDKEIYNTVPGDTYFDYLKQNARHYRDIGLTDNDRIVTFSTCSYEFNDARMVLLAKIL